MFSPRRILLLVVSLLVALGLSADSRALFPPEQPATRRPIVSLEKVNATARAAYRAARERALARTGPVVLWDGDDLIFRYGEYRRLSKPTPALYTDLKTVSHVALGLASLLGPPQGSLEDARLFACKGYLETIESARQGIRGRDLTKRQIDRQEKILDGCRDLLTEVIRAKKIDVRKVLSDLRKLRVLLDANTTEAARAQIDGLHREMTQWRARLSKEEWNRVKVVVQGSAMARKQNLAVQYFACLLGETGEGRRIIYAEALFDETKALNLLGTHLLDTQIGIDFFDDPLRMHRDLLSDAARTYLDELFKKEKAVPSKEENREKESKPGNQ